MIWQLYNTWFAYHSLHLVRHLCFSRVTSAHGTLVSFLPKLWPLNITPNGESWCEGPFGFIWYLGERVTFQSTHQWSPCVLMDPPSSMFYARMLSLANITEIKDKSGSSLCRFHWPWVWLWGVSSVNHDPIGSPLHHAFLFYSTFKWCHFYLPFLF